MIPELSIEAFSIFANGLDHPECLAFDRHGDLWIGGEAGQIYRVSPEGKVQLVTNLGGFCAGLAFSPKGELFVCNPKLGIVRVDPTGDFTVFATHAGERKLVCPNYGLFDTQGSYYVTDSGNWKKNNGVLIRYRGAAESRPAQGESQAGEVMAGPMGYTNGLALAADEKSLFMVESDTNSIYRVSIEDFGQAGKCEPYASGCGRFPDGLTLDAEGNLYVCCYASDEIWRISPDQKKSLMAWDPFAILLGSPTNMAFGGPNFDEMFVANLARTTVTRAKVGRKGQLLANQRVTTRLKPRPSSL
jgi:gluconolactonase